MDRASRSELCMGIERGDVRSAFVLCEQLMPDNLRAFASFAFPRGIMWAEHFDALADGFAWWLGLLEIQAIQPSEPTRMKSVSAAAGASS